MCQWDGQELKYNTKGMPHVTKIKGKPVSVGAEFKCSIDGESNIMLHLEVQEGKDAMALKEFSHGPDKLPHHAAVTLRCVQSWRNSYRHIIADSYFSSTTTAIAMLKHGLHFTGIVKTAHANFPKDVMNEMDSKSMNRGDTVAFRTSTKVNDEKHKLLAVGWKSKVMKKVISTCGNTLPGKAHVVKRSKVIDKDGKWETKTYTKSTNRPQVIVDLFEHFSAIDVHDHYRQGILECERNFPTKTWWIRIFTTIMGMIYTDCYFAY